MRRPLAIPLLVLIGCNHPPAALVAPVQEPPLRPLALRYPRARTVEVVETIHGVKVADPYRWMEQGGAELRRFLEAEDKLARTFLRAALRRAEFLSRHEELDRFQTRHLEMAVRGSFFFSTRVNAGENHPSLHLYDVKSHKERVLFSAEAEQGDHHVSLDWFFPSRDGALVAIGVSEHGGEESELRVIRSDTGATVDGPIPNTRMAEVSWETDGKSFYYWRFDPDPKGEFAASVGTARLPMLERMRTYRHLLGTDYKKDLAVFGYGVVPDLSDKEFPFVFAGEEWAIGLVVAGATEKRLFATRAADLRRGKPAWKQVVGYEEKLSAFDVRGSDLYLVARGKNADNQLVRIDLRKPSAARVMPLPAGVVPSAVNVAADGLYLVLHDIPLDAAARVGFDGRGFARLSIPQDTHVDAMATDLRTAGALLRTQRWTESARLQFFSKGKGAPLEIAAAGDAEGAAKTEVVATLEFAHTADGVDIPITLLSRPGLQRNGRNPTKLKGYGSYGTLYGPASSQADRAWIDAGGLVAYAHIRGGGGGKVNAWHDSASRKSKEVTVKDFIASAEYLIARGYTSTPYLGAYGRSAGGMMVGAAVTTRPELFRAAVVGVGAVNPMRFETTPGGAFNVHEFGSVADEAEFHTLQKIDAYQQARPGVQYPALLLTGAVNDTRVLVWQPAKLAARLQSFAPKRPVLLRVEFDDGHWSSRKRFEEQYADEDAFLWSQFDL